MSLRMEQVLTEGIAQLSYVIGDDGSGIAVVIDPRPDVDIYLEIARKYKLSITHVFETHIHADFVSGARELAHRAGSAEIYVSGEGDAKYDFPHRTLSDGDTFEIGSIVLTARHTPGHTPEHMSYLAAEKKRRDTPFAVFTGDSLFVNSAGRPDLLGGDMTEQLVKQLFHTLKDFYLKLDDHVLIYPGHGHGSPCGADIGDRLVSSIGYERAHNPFLQHRDLKSFHDYALSTAPPTPTYYPRMKKVNAAGPSVLGHLPDVPAMPAKQFSKAVEDGRAVLIDTRTMLAFGGGHIAGALNIGGRAELSVWAGWMLDPEVPILLVLEDDAEVEKVVSLFVRTGYTKFAGYLAGGMKAWDNAGLPLQTLQQMPVQELKEDGKDVLRLDVRSPDEWNRGHMPGAKHVFLPELPEAMDGGKKDARLDKKKPIAVYCDSGYRAASQQACFSLGVTRMCETSPAAGRPGHTPVIRSTKTARKRRRDPNERPVFRDRHDRSGSDRRCLVALPGRRAHRRTDLADVSIFGQGAGCVDCLRARRRAGRKAGGVASHDEP